MAPGLANFRDLGGLPTVDGGNVRPGRLYRSDHLTPSADLTAWLAGQVTTVVDLRTAMEQDHMGRYVGTGLADVVDVVEQPILDGSVMRDRARAGDLDLGEMYQAIAFDHADEVASVVTLLAEPARLPALVSCTAGKDRTGVVCAVVLSAIGVADEDVLDDYDRSAAAAEGLRARVIEKLVGIDLSMLPASAFSVDRSALAGVLDGIRDRHGDAVRYLRANGAPDDVGSRLRTALVG